MKLVTVLLPEAYLEGFRRACEGEYVSK